jgi:alpha-L-fucosidase
MSVSVQRFEPTWESLKQVTVPEWYQRGKFGIFIHWGLYAVPAFAHEWYPRNMYIQGEPEFEHHVKTYGPQTEFGYKDFIPLFKAEHYDPDAWVALFAEAGARFVVPVAEHHDGFCLYDSALTRWTSVQMGPHRDLIGDLAQAVRARGMVFGLSSHRAEHWWFFNGGRHFPSDVQDPAYADFYGPAVVHTEGKDGDMDSGPWPSAEYLEDWLARTCEVVDKYQPLLVWFDWWIDHPAFEPYLQRFAAYYYNKGLEWGQGVAINYKNDSYPDGTAILDLERGQLKDIRPMFWQNDTSVSKNSWGYISHHDYKTVNSIIQDLVDVVSKNGALLLNVGPRPDGTIPEPEQEMLRAIGRWLAVNGEAIYDTHPWHIFGEGPTEVPEGMFTDTLRAAFTAQDIRYTQKDDALYAILLDRPQGTITLRSLGSGSPLAAARITGVSLLGGPAGLTWRQDGDGLHVEMPAQVPGEHAFTLRIALG